jgi:hypothetical protein
LIALRHGVVTRPRFGARDLGQVRAVVLVRLTIHADDLAVLAAEVPRAGRLGGGRVDQASSSNRSTLL